MAVFKLLQKYLGVDYPGDGKDLDVYQGVVWSREEGDLGCYETIVASESGHVDQGSGHFAHTGTDCSLDQNPERKEPCSHCGRGSRSKHSRKMALFS